MDKQLDDETLCGMALEKVQQPVKPFTAGHTPGPWKIRECGGTKSGGYIRTYAGDRRICKLEPLKGQVTEDEYLANARLIAAAPDLLWVLEGIRPLVLRATTSSGLTEEEAIKTTWLGHLDAAIAKARGEV